VHDGIREGLAERGADRRRLGLEPRRPRRIVRPDLDAILLGIASPRAVVRDPDGGIARALAHRTAV
jgi:hypothetical protein